MRAIPKTDVSAKVRPMTAFCCPALVGDGDAAALETPEETAAEAAEALLRTIEAMEVALARLVAPEEEAIDEALDEEAPDVEATELPDDVPDRLPVLAILLGEPDEADDEAETAAVTMAAPPDGRLSR